MKPDVWSRPKVTIDTFIDDPYFLGLGDKVYPKVRQICREIMAGGYSEGVEVAGIGSGKSMSCEILACYAAHHLLSLRNPHKYYNLTPDKDIVIINMGISATQANNVVFSGISNMVQASPFFSGFNPNILVGSIGFDEHKVNLISGNSKSTTPLGYNVFFAVLDEAAFYMDNDNVSVAEDIYTALQRRIVSRFGYDGLIMAISSPRYENDFVMKKLEESKKYPDKIYGIQLPSWKVKAPKHLDSENKFYFNSRKSLVEEVLPAYATDVDYLTAKTFNPEHEWWEISGEYKRDFKVNPEKAKRDFGAVPSSTIEAFLPHPLIVKKIFAEDRPDPVQITGEYKLDQPPLRMDYYIHVDLALNKNGRGDYAGFCMAHFDGWEEDELSKEKRKKVRVDLVEKIGAGPMGEVDFESIRQRVYTLKSMGYPIALVTFDQFNSADSQQLLRKRGIKSELLSVDRTIDPYNTLKELIYDGRISIHQHPEAFSELCALEVTKGMKVDHPPNGSKDCADAICGAVFNVITHTGFGGMGVQAVGVTTHSVVGNHLGNATTQQRIDRINQLQKLVDKGILGK